MLYVYIIIGNSPSKVFVVLYKHIFVILFISIEFKLYDIFYFIVFKINWIYCHEYNKMSCFFLIRRMLSTVSKVLIYLPKLSTEYCTLPDKHYKHDTLTHVNAGYKTTTV